MKFAMNGKAFRANYDKVKKNPGKLWENDQGREGQVYTWPKSTYIAEPPFFDDFTMEPKALDSGVQGARIMALFGDSITTDHISPAGCIKEASPAGKYLLDNGVLQGRLQQLRRAPRQPRRDDARHLRQRAHQEPDDPGRAPTAPARKAATRCTSPAARRCSSTTRP